MRSTVYAINSTCLKDVKLFFESEYISYDTHVICYAKKHAVTMGAKIVLEEHPTHIITEQKEFFNINRQEMRANIHYVTLEWLLNSIYK